MNDFSQKNPETLVIFIEQLLSAAQDTPAAFGWTTAELTALAATRTAAMQAIASQATAQAQEKAATAAKAARKTDMVQQLARLAKQAYLDPDVDDALLHQVGLSPRASGGSRPTAPQTVTGLAAMPNADGTVRLSWSRSGNAERAAFQVEASADGASWSSVALTSRVSATLDGFAPGAAAWFRVTAVNASVAARPSAAVAIYAPVAPSVTLRLAA